MPKKSARRKSTSIYTPLLQWLGRFSIAEKLLALLLGTLGLRALLDPDFGWHLRSGTDLIRTWQVPKLDIYSHTLPDWPWVNHEWLMDGIVAGIYHYLGSFTLVLLFALFIAGAFLLASSITKVELKYKLLASVIAVLAALPILGVRMQMVTLFGMGLTLYLLYRFRDGQLKSLWIMPLVMLIWTNLHGGFVMGLVIMAIFWLVETIKLDIARHWPTSWKRLKISEATLSPAQSRHLLIIGLISGAVTFINPYGWGLYYDFYKLFTNDFAIKGISEWQRVILTQPMARNFMLYLIMFGGVLAIAYRKVEPTRWAIALVFLGLSFLYWRNMPFFMIMSAGFLAEILQTHTHLVFDRLTRNRWTLLVMTVIIGVIFAQRLLDVVPKLQNPVAGLRAGYYPIDAVLWAKANPDKIGKVLYNEYNWGGLLVWQFPEQKVFIDGRMPFWAMPNLPTTPDANDWPVPDEVKRQRFVFFDEQYTNAAQAGSLEIIEQKYGADWALIRADLPLSYALSGQKHWQRIYKDDFAIIYRRIEDVPESE